MQVNDFVGHRAGVLENHRANGGYATPLPRLLFARAGNPERIHGVGPGRIGPFALVERWERTARWAFFHRRNRFERFGSDEFQRRRDGRAEVSLVQADASLRIFQQVSERIDLFA